MAHPGTLKRGDRVHVARNATWTDGTTSTPLARLLGKVATVTHTEDDDGDVGLHPDASVDPRFLTLIEEPTTEPASPITDEQRAAVEWLRRTMNIQLEPHAGLLFDLLPSELTNPQPVLPTEPGHYQDEEGRHWLHQVYDGQGDHPDVDQWLDWNGQNGAPPTGNLVRLVPERPQITREQVAAVYDVHHHPSDEAVDALLALVNGADQ